MGGKRVPLSIRHCIGKVISFSAILSLTVGLCGLPALAENGQTGERLSQASAGTIGDTDSKRFITIDFDNVDIRLFIKYISELTGKNFVVDKAVQGNVTILSPTKISEEEAYRVFESVLEVHGFTTVQSGSVIKILPAAAARSKNVETIRMGMSSHPEDKVVTQLVPLKNSSPDDMKKVLTPLLSKTSVMVSHPQSGMLIITETLSNIQRLLAIIETLDVEFTEEEVVVIQLENAAATSVAQILSSIYQRSRTVKGRTATTQDVKVVPYERVNSLVIFADRQELRRLRNIVALLDTPAERGEGNINVYYLQNAYATELAKVLTALPTGQTAETEKGKAPTISKDVKITADEETNSLIITASREEFNVLEGVIKKLDIPRQMVYLEALILEVNAAKDFEVGVEWALGGKFADDTGVLASGFSSNSENPFGTLGGINGDDPSLGDGFTLGVIKQGIKIGGVTFPNIGAVLNAYKSDADINIISTPQILTTDNKQAAISVGENVPYITSQNTTDAQQDYTQYEYRDVATKMTITPRINLADTMRLEIETEITRLKGSSLDLTPTTFTRTASTTVVVNDSDTVVIGGIIGEDSNLTEIKVPLLGDIPGLGWLFKSQATSTIRTNMFIFITPKIIRNPADIASVTLKKEDKMEEVMPGAKETIYRVPNKNHAMILTERGFEYLVQERNVEAREYFEEALELDPENPYTLLNIGVIEEREGNYPAAAQYYQKVITTGTTATALEASDSSKEGLSLVQIARENIERLRQTQNRR
ncbi:type II secretion system secretin GspD [Desulfosediminicola ganghwensis]|uniref:type II secretion system secretin GspD n=1 Tax=Desulfosediminicola ganghwensis TaxID=2569540 RepID=UPI0010AD6B8A|nr:type II secretion system secretin GspD [Desulfosediminicola ganghwensis]